jgi:hypothetical protein
MRILAEKGFVARGNDERRAPIVPAQQIFVARVTHEVGAAA